MFDFLTEIANNFEDGIEIALNVIKDGKSIKLLKEFVRDTGNISKLEMLV